MKSFFTELFNYNHHFNSRVLDIIKANPSDVSDKSIQWINHVINAHHIWNARISDTPTTQTVWGVSPLEKLKNLNFENWESSIHLIKISDLNQRIGYTNSKGQSFSNTIRDILFHVINHSTHHRAQIASDLKLSGIEPPVSDYIFYKRDSPII